MTKKQTEVNDQNTEIAAAEATATSVTPETVQAGEGDEEPPLEELAGGEDPEPDTQEEPVEETPVPAETAAPLMNHGTHNAAVNGLQTSPGYDPSKL